MSKLDNLFLNMNQFKISSKINTLIWVIKDKIDSSHKEAIKTELEPMLLLFMIQL